MRWPYAVITVFLLASCGDDPRGIEDWAEEAAPACTQRAEAFKEITPPNLLNTMDHTVNQTTERVDAARVSLSNVKPPADPPAATQVREHDNGTIRLVDALKTWSSATITAKNYTAMETDLNGIMDMAKNLDAKATAMGLAACADTAALLENPVFKAGVTNIKSAFIAEVESVCLPGVIEFNEKMKKARGEAGLRLASELMDKHAAKLAELKPPLTNREQWDGYLADMKALAGKWRTALVDLRATNLATVEAGIQSLSVQADSKAAAYGMKNCGVAYVEEEDGA